MNFEEMTIEELNRIIADATKAKETLVFKEKSVAWEKVVKVIKDFVDEYGEIEIETFDETYDISQHSIFEEFGTIKLSS